MRIHITFEIDRFNLSEEKSHFINPCCFGEDLAGWLRKALARRFPQVGEPGQEDWGWYLELEADSQRYFLAIGGNSYERAENPDMGEWRIIIEKQRGLLEKLRGRNQLVADDPVVVELKAILSAEADFRNLLQDEEGG